MKTLTLMTLLLISISIQTGMCQAGVPTEINQTVPALKVLIVVAHPDDESCFAATIYQVTHNLGGIADQLVVTNGEGGYRYSLLAEPYYGVALTNEIIGRAALPEIRKSELLGSGRILGVAKHYLLDETDTRYTQDIDEVLREHWNSARVETEILRRLESGQYDFVFTLFPTADTHGAHKAATLLAINAVQRMGSRQPVILGCQDSSTAAPMPLDWTGFHNDAHSFTVGKGRYSTDRTVKFGFRNALTYQVVVNWVIAEHKSQGAFQMDMNRFDHEQFAMLGAKSAEAESRAERLFSELEADEQKVDESVFLSQSLCQPPAICRTASPSQTASNVPHLVGPHH